MSGFSKQLGWSVWVACLCYLVPSVSAAPVSFVRDVLPVLGKAGCASGSCHARPGGQNGFELSVFAYNPKADYQEIAVEGRGRRVFPASPEESLLLKKPTLGVPHEGGQRFTVGSEWYQLLERWIREGMVYQVPNEPELDRIVVDPADGRYGQGSSKALSVTAHYADGSTRDVTALAIYDTADQELVEVDEAGKMQVGQSMGETAVVVRYMGQVGVSHITVPAPKTLPTSEYASLPVNNFIDRIAYEHFQKLGLKPSEPCEDGEFIRRASLDTIGTLPAAEEARSFHQDTGADKRNRWIERLLQDPAYADHWAVKWADLIRPNPDRAGVKSVYILDQWLREQFRQNTPYDQFVKQLVLARGSTHRHGPAVMYRDRRKPASRTTMFSQLFLGIRLDCARCHHHPNETWSQHDFFSMAAFFAEVKQKGPGVSPPISGGEEFVYHAPGGSVTHPVTGETLKPRPLHGAVMEIDKGRDPRESLFHWMTRSDNPYFARAIVNRVWAEFFGRGFVEPVDDFRDSNPPTLEPLLDALAQDFVENGYDLKHLMRTILQSHLYQLSSLPNDTNVSDTRNFSRAYRRRIPAEVLADAVSRATETRDNFQGMPPEDRAIRAWNQKLYSEFMDAFGRPNSSEDPPCFRNQKPSVVQALHLMNSNTVQSKLADKKGRAERLASSELSEPEIIRELYLATFSRQPTDEEVDIARRAFKTEGVTRKDAIEDLMWVLLNSAEFVFNH